MILLVKALGVLTMLSALVTLVLSATTDISGPTGKASLVTILIMQLGIGAFVFYGAKLKQAGSDVAEKIYPSSIAAFILFLAFAHRWFMQGI